MNELILATYIRILQDGLVENDKQESAGRLLLSSVALQSDAHVTTDLGSKKISRLVNRKDPVPDDIKKAVQKKKSVRNGIYKYFKENVLPDLNPITIYDTLEKLRKVIEQDPVIAERKKVFSTICSTRMISVGSLWKRSFIPCSAITKPKQMLCAHRIHRSSLRSTGNVR